MSRYLKKLAACGARPAIQYVLIKIQMRQTYCVMEGVGGTGTYMVETRIVGITRSGITSKRRRTNNQAVGLHKEKSQIYAHEQRNTTCCTYNTRSSARAQTAGASPAHYAARSNSKTRSRSPVQIPINSQTKKGMNAENDARGRIGIRRATGIPRWCRSSSSTARRRTRPAAQISQYARERTSYP